MGEDIKLTMLWSSMCMCSNETLIKLISTGSSKKYVFFQSCILRNTMGFSHFSLLFGDFFTFLKK